MSKDKIEDYDHNEDLARVLMVRNSDTLNTALLYLRQYKEQICKEQREICARVVKRQKNINGIKGLIGKDESANAILNSPEPKV